MTRYYTFHLSPFTFHLSIDGKRTTVSLDPTLAKYLAVSLGTHPETPEAKAVIRAWAAKSLAEWIAFDAHLPLSAQVRQLAIQRTVDAKWVQTKIDA